MPERMSVYTPSPRLRTLLGPFAFRPRLVAATGAGIATFVVLALVGDQLQGSLRAVLSWDVLCLCFTVLIMGEFKSQESEDIRLFVAQQDEGQGLILLVVLVAVAASLIAVGLELSKAKDDHGLFKSLRIGVAGLTVALSWFTVQLIFALHYAHQYYAPDRTTPEEDDVVGGLAFPGSGPPDYWDFLHFSVVIGVACQTADIAFTGRHLRHIGTVHGLIAFGFNTVVLALTINLLAGLF